MSGWKAKRFWKEAKPVLQDTGYAVQLDGRPVRTPAKTPLILPTLALAEAVAAEWDAQDGEVKPLSMPHTRSANAALDKVRPQHGAVAAMLSEYGGSDLLCYRAVGPEALAARQAAAWDPLLDWAQGRFGARLLTGAGVMHIAQDPTLLARFDADVAAIDDFGLAAFHDLVAISGSLVVGFAVIEGKLDSAEAWAIARIDEIWQVETWGEDELFAESEAAKKVAFDHAARFYNLSRPT